MADLASGEAKGARAARLVTRCDSRLSSGYWKTCGNSSLEASALEPGAGAAVPLHAAFVKPERSPRKRR